MALERTFVMLKPDAVARGLVGEILARFERKGLKIVAMRLEHADPAVVEKHYAVHKERPFYTGLVEYIRSGPVVPMVVEGEDAIAQSRALMGATDPAKGRPGEIRFDFGLQIGRNLIHGSDSAETASFEAGLWFPDGVSEYGRAGQEWLTE